MGVGCLTSFYLTPGDEFVSSLKGRGRLRSLRFTAGKNGDCTRERKEGREALVLWSVNGDVSRHGDWLW